jgi:cell division protein FtsB
MRTPESLEDQLAGWQRDLEDLDAERADVVRRINRLEAAIAARDAAEAAAQPDLFQEPTP